MLFNVFQQLTELFKFITPYPKEKEKQMQKISNVILYMPARKTHIWSQTACAYIHCKHFIIQATNTNDLYMDI